MDRTCRSIVRKEKIYKQFAWEIEGFEDNIKMDLKLG